jgi:hypothetical protein
MTNPQSTPEAVAAILAGQSSDRLGQRIFVGPLHRQVAFRPAPLLHHPTGIPLTHPVLSARMFRCAPAPLRA